MPIARMHMGEGPPNSSQTKSTHDPWILIDILMVIIVDELMSKCLTENDPDDSHQKNTDKAVDALLSLRARVGMLGGDASPSAPGSY